MPAPDSPFKSLSTCQNTMMAAYQTKIRQQQQFLKQVREILPTHLEEHLLYCVVSAKQCLLYVDAEEWAAQVRAFLPIILHTLQASNLPKLELIQVRIVSLPKPQQVSRKANLPSKRNIELLRESFQAIEDDELKSALARLSRTLEKLS